MTHGLNEKTEKWEINLLGEIFTFDNKTEYDEVITQMGMESEE